MYAEDFDEDGAPINEQYFDGYSDISVHETMLNDAPRMKFYSDVLSDPATGINGSLVVDVGAGTGILSAWTLLLGGAEHVVAIEGSDVATSVLPRTLAAAAANSTNGGKFTVVHDSVEEMVKRGPQDFLARHPHISVLLRSGRRFGFVVSEWMGFYLVHECMLPSVILARDFFAQLNGLFGGDCPQMIPSHAQLLASPMSTAPIYKEAEQRFSAKSPLLRGIDLSHVGAAIVDQKLLAANPLIMSIPRDCVICPAVLVNKSHCHGGEMIELDSITLEEALHLESTCTISYDSTTVDNWMKSTGGSDGSEGEEEGVRVDGFAIWFRVSFGGRVLSTGPMDPPTHWMQTVVLLPKEVRDDPSSMLQVRTLAEEKAAMTILVKIVCHDTERRQYTIEVEMDDSNVST